MKQLVQSRSKPALDTVIHDRSNYKKQDSSLTGDQYRC